jgi:hypothetical protein
MKNFKLSNSTMERLELLLQQLSKVYPQTELQLADSNKLMSCNCGGGAVVVVQVDAVVVVVLLVKVF